MATVNNNTTVKSNSVIQYEDQLKVKLINKLQTPDYIQRLFNYITLTQALIEIETMDDNGLIGGELIDAIKEQQQQLSVELILQLDLPDLNEIH